MDAVAVVEQAREMGITLRADGAYIRYRPKIAASAEFVAALRQHKAELLAYLSSESDSLPGQSVQHLLAWASKLAEQDRVLTAPVSYLEVPRRTITTERVSYYAGHYLRTIISARIGQQTGGWGMFDVQWHEDQEREALAALAALRDATEESRRD